MTISPSTITIPMSVQIAYMETVFVGPLAEILTGTLTSLDDSMLPETLTNLRDYIFQNNPNLESVNLTHVQTLGISVFKSCNITDLELPALESVGMQALAYNPMTEVSLPGLTDIGNQMFQGCESLERAEFETATSISRRAFYGCASLNTLILRASSVVNWTGTDMFTGTPIADGTGYIYVPSDLVSSYRAASGWSDFSSQIRSIDDLNESGGAS